MSLLMQKTMRDFYELMETGMINRQVNKPDNENDKPKGQWEEDNYGE